MLHNVNGLIVSEILRTFTIFISLTPYVSFFGDTNFELPLLPKLSCIKALKYPT